MLCASFVAIGGLDDEPNAIKTALLMDRHPVLATAVVVVGDTDTDAQAVSFQTRDQRLAATFKADIEFERHTKAPLKVVLR
jgi:hypothetical protein